MLLRGDPQSTEIHVTTPSLNAEVKIGFEDEREEMDSGSKLEVQRQGALRLRIALDLFTSRYNIMSGISQLSQRNPKHYNKGCQLY